MNSTEVLLNIRLLTVGFLVFINLTHSGCIVDQPILNDGSTEDHREYAAAERDPELYSEWADSVLNSEVEMTSDARPEDRDDHSL